LLDHFWRQIEAEYVDAAVVEGVRAAGYGYGCAIWPSEYTGQHALPRTFIGESDSSPRLWAKGLRHWLTWDYRGPGARRFSPRNAA